MTDFNLGPPQAVPPESNHERRWSHLGTAAIAHVISVIGTELDRVDRKMPMSRKGQRFTSGELIARHFLDGVSIVLDDIRDELLTELDCRHGGAH